MCIHVHMAVQLEECNADTDDRTIQFANSSILCGCEIMWCIFSMKKDNRTQNKWHQRKEKKRKNSIHLHRLHEHHITNEQMQFVMWMRNIIQCFDTQRNMGETKSTSER